MYMYMYACIHVCVVIVVRQLFCIRVSTIIVDATIMNCGQVIMVMLHANIKSDSNTNTYVVFCVPLDHFIILIQYLKKHSMTCVIEYKQ